VRTVRRIGGDGWVGQFNGKDENGIFDTEKSKNHRTRDRRSGVEVFGRFSHERARVGAHGGPRDEFLSSKKGWQVTRRTKLTRTL
jgi:hypothetical protein